MIDLIRDTAVGFITYIMANQIVNITNQTAYKMTNQKSGFSDQRDSTWGGTLSSYTAQVASILSSHRACKE